MIHLTGFFEIEEEQGILNFKNPPDYENPEDLNKDNIYIWLAISCENDSLKKIKFNIKITIRKSNDMFHYEKCCNCF